MNKKFKDEQIVKGMTMILEGLGIDLTDPNFIDTPNRVMRSYHEILGGINNENEIKKILSTSFPTSYGGMVTIGPIHCYSMCPHHFLPVTYEVYIAYIPKKEGLGLSKLPRVVELLAQRPALQEDFTNDIVQKIQETINPRGVAVYVKGEHFCMKIRGVKKFGCSTITSEVTGFFKENIATKEEFLNFIKINGK